MPRLADTNAPAAVAENVPAVQNLVPPQHDEPKSITMVVMGKPTPLQQRKLSQSGYYYSLSDSDMNKFRKAIKDQHPPHTFRGAVAVEATFFFSAPNAQGKVAWKRGRRSVNIAVKDCEYPSCKPFPDVDNLQKFIMDGMNKRVYDDDVQVVEVIAKKRFTQREERTVITVMKPSVVEEKVMLV